MALTDADIHEPPMTGLYHYNTWTPANGSFPAVGGSYVDPVFGETVRRLTDYTGLINVDDIYTFHWANADGTLAFTRQTGEELRVISTTTGATVYADEPQGLNISEIRWHPTDPDKYFYLSGAALVRRNLAAQTDTTLHTFAATLESTGGSHDWVDRTGRYFVVVYDALIHVWDSQTDTLYAGEFAVEVAQPGNIGITPDGNYVFSTGQGVSYPAPNHFSHLINHGTQTVGSAVGYWGLSNGHESYTSTTDGHNYMTAPDSGNTGDVYRVDITLDQSGQTEAQQRAANQVLFAADISSMSQHFSSPGTGALRDWAFVSNESVDDDFDETPTDWQAYEQEIVAVNLLTLDIRRLAHHRSRGLTQYPRFPRVSSAWDGSLILWASDFNINTSNYADLYAMPFMVPQKHCLVLK